ncbi:MAG: hypothetical protein V1863_02545 [Candidatus Omnitrophota bacterium]
MITKSRLSIFLFLLFFAANPLAYADKIYLKNGKMFEGKLIGKSNIRYLFHIDTAGESLPMSFFMEYVDKIELGKDTVEEQIPYLKEVESMKVRVKEDESKIYELSLYNKSTQVQDQVTFSESQLKKSLAPDEQEYYQKFTDILNKYEDKDAFIRNIYANLTSVRSQDFTSAKQYMDELYFELNNFFVPQAFRKPHQAYLEVVRETFLAFGSLEQERLDEASKHMKASDDARQKFVEEFRSVILSRKSATTAETEEAKTPFPHEGTNPQAFLFERPHSPAGTFCPREF